MVKVAIIQNIATPYGIKLFDRLSKVSYIEKLDVFYCLERYEDRNWTLNYSQSYRYEFLSGTTINLPLINLPCSINPSIFKLIKKNRYDVVIVCGFTDITAHLAYIKCKFEKIPIILWSELFGNYLFKYHKIYVPVIRFFSNQSDALIVTTSKSKEYHHEMGTPNEDIFISGNSIDENEYIVKSEKYRKMKSVIKDELSLTNEKNILFVGRFLQRKGIESLIKAFKKLDPKTNDVGLILVGDGPDRYDLQEVCKYLNVDNVHFTGFISDEDKIKYYSVSDVFVLPSFWDIQPLVLQEAMACSLSIVTTKEVGGSRDIILEGKNGFIINAGDIDSLCSSIKSALNNSSTMGDVSLDIIKKKWSLDISVDGIVSAIKYVLNKEVV